MKADFRTFLQVDVSVVPHRLAILLVVIASLLPGYIKASELDGRVVGIADGDTLTLLVNRAQYKVRLSGIDTPERGQPYGDAARKKLSDLVFDKEVRVESRKIDRYGRTIGRVWVQPIECPRCGKTLDVSLALLTTGMAWWYRYYANEQPEEERGQYEFAEFEAKSKKVGLWQEQNPIPPWDWRRRGVSASAAQKSVACNIKGNISGSGERIYHVPGQKHYSQTQISPSKGEQYFCSEAEARAAGWRLSRM